MNIVVEGPAFVYLTSPGVTVDDAIPAASDSTLVGTTESGVQISIGGQAHRVMSDDLGGSEGVPNDILFMGAMASIRGVMVKTNSAGLEKMMRGLNAVNYQEGEFPGVGAAIFAKNYGYGLLIGGFEKSYWFPKCELVTAPREFNVSSTERKTSFTAAAYPIRGFKGISEDPTKGECALLLYKVGLGIGTCVDIDDTSSNTDGNTSSNTPSNTEGNGGN